MAKNFIGVEIDSTQFKSLIQLCNKMGAEVGQKAFRKAMKSGSEKIQAQVQSEIPEGALEQAFFEPTESDWKFKAKKRSGRLKRSIKIKTTTKYQPFFWKSQVVSNPGSSREDPNGAYYAFMVEYGHRIFFPVWNHLKNKWVAEDTGKKMPANPFMERAAKAAEPKIRAEFESEVKSTLHTLWKRGVKKGLFVDVTGADFD